MTIKEMEKILDVPRATIRYYEREGLILPERAENGYRDYSDHDVEILKKVIILRKIGTPMSDIEDYMDGEKSMDALLEGNIETIQKQLEELKGAMNLCRKMKDDFGNGVHFDTNRYWNYVEEEEQKGNHFFEIMKDFAKEEKRSFFDNMITPTDEEGKPSHPLAGILATIIIFGGIYCLLGRGWTIENFMDGIETLTAFVIIGFVATAVIFVVGKKSTWVAQNRQTSEIIFIALLAIVLIVISLLL